MSMTIDSNGRISRGQNVIVPHENAGVGDLVYKLTSLLTDKAANDTPSNFKVVGRGTATGATVTVNGTSYTLYGCIYGFVNGEAMIVAPVDKGTYAWTTLSSSDLGPGDTSWPLMRNGLNAHHSQMNTARNASYIYKADAATPTILPDAYQETSLSAATFVSGATDEIKKRFGTWTEYIRQTLRVNGAPGTPFGRTDTNVQVHEFGRYMGQLAHAAVVDAGSDVYPAFSQCYAHGEGGGTWWLPSMFEFGELMIDEHLDLVNENIATWFGRVSNNATYWSCVRGTATTAWQYRHSGMSYRTTSTASTNTYVRPVTLLKLT